MTAPCILALDASTGPCSAALWRGGRVMAYVETVKPVMQSASLVPMVEMVLAKGGVTYRDLTLVACTVGPGSFTGIRVGLATARGIAFAAGIPSAGYTTLEVLAHAAKDDAQVLAILNAGKGEWYYQLFASGAPRFEPRLAALETALADAPPPATIAGNVSADAAGYTRHTITFPRADALAMLAASGAAAHELRPYYIRLPDAKLPTTKNF